MEFGFLIDDKSFKFDEFEIAPKNDFPSILQNFYNHAEVSKGWFYGPKISLPKSSREKKFFGSNAPVIYSSFFEMSPTHIITSSTKCTEEHIRFLILGYGFLQGLYLVPKGWSHLIRTAYEPGLLNGLYLSNNDYIKGMEQVNRFYIDSSVDERKNMFACIHWFLLGQSYEYAWDKFDAQYKVLDGIYHLAKSKNTNKNPSHAQRPKYLADKYGIDLPIWAELDSKGKSKLSTLRNDLAHEAIYAGQPIGFSYPEENYNLEFSAFNAKLISACLGLKTPYLKKPVNNRMYSLWNIQ